MKGAPFAVALVLAGLCAGASIRALAGKPPEDGAPTAKMPPALGPAVVPEAADRARRTGVRLARALIALQRPDGSFEHAPSDEDFLPEARQIAAAALAVAALARAKALGWEVEGLAPALDRGIDHLKARQAQARGGAFGAMAAGPSADPRPSLEATSAALMALVCARRPEDETSLKMGIGAFQRGVAYGAFDGWTRALAALAVDALIRERATDLLAKPARGLLAVGEVDRVDCGDFRLAEAIVRRLRAGPEGDPLVEQVLDACLEVRDRKERPLWTGDSSDLQSWYLQAWLAARHRYGAEWFRRLVKALEEGLEPQGRLPGGIYADLVTQNACGVLALAEGLGAPST